MKKFFKSCWRQATLMAMVMLILMGLPAALSADASIARKEAGLQSFLVAGSGTQIYKGALVCVNASGYLVPAADTAGYKFAGIAYENVLNAGSDGDYSCRVHTEGVFELTATSIEQKMVGQLMYVTNDGCVDETSTNYVTVGTLVEYKTNTSGWVDIGNRTMGSTISQSWAVSGGQPFAVNSVFTLATAGVHKSLQGIVTYTPATSGCASSMGVSGKAALAAGKTFSGASQGLMWGVQGNVDIGAGATLNQASSIFAGLRGVITAGATPVFTDAEGICCAYLDNLCTTNMNALATGFSAYLFCNNSGGWMNAAIYLRSANKVSNLFRFEDCGSMVVAQAAKAGTPATIQCDWEGTEYFINMYQAS